MFIFIQILVFTLVLILVFIRLFILVFILVFKLVNLFSYSSMADPWSTSRYTLARSEFTDSRSTLWASQVAGLLKSGVQGFAQASAVTRPASSRAELLNVERLLALLNMPGACFGIQ